MRIREKTAGYIRVSTNEQVISALSLDAQRQKVQAQAELSDLELVGIDFTRSGKDLPVPLERTSKAKRPDGGKDVDLINSAEALDTGSAEGKSWTMVANKLTCAGVRTRRGTAFNRQDLFKITKKTGII